MKVQVALILLLLGGYRPAAAQNKLKPQSELLKDYKLVLEESFDTISHPSQLSDKWQFTGDAEDASAGGGEYYPDPTTNNWANYELRQEGAVRYLRLKAIRIDSTESDYNNRSVYPDHADSTRTPRIAKFRSGLLMTKRGVAGPVFDTPCTPNDNPGGSSRGFLYGIFQARMRVDKKPTFPAFWLWGEPPHSGSWPTGLQVNIYEGRDFEYNTSRIFGVGYDDEADTYKPHRGENTWVEKHGSRDLADDFHTYTCVWTPTEISFFFDDDKIVTFNDADIMRKYNRCPTAVILSLQMWSWYTESAHLDVDYIRVYKPIASPTEFPAYVVDASTEQLTFFQKLGRMLTPVPFTLRKN
ncbi:glycoside hydrolase family 16 protein [Hymenobacter persicinus]|uniref:Glycosyl hydrolase family protein n=1 Tax=Hymenobacter persicinus TaxID=2025506 RepID=A0A4Q5LG84_9BACT|nr:family 16 glycosylhydrolase [Hymenobacter persicinus]RYU82836.1 glycosyl hydrolase family protein [Hymenobacter persicinus]